MFQLQLFSKLQFALAAAAIILVLYLVWGRARKGTTFRDNLLPQLPPQRQTYSLARSQMAFWFVLIFSSFVFLYLLLWDFNTVSNQALALMGISAATALASIAVDVVKDSPADAVNRGLQALGLCTYSDVLRVQNELAAREAELGKHPQAHAAAGGVPFATTHALSPAEQRRQQLQIEIQDRHNILRTYDDKIQPFVTQGWFKDITTDLNGTAIHRLQVVCWTVALGFVFLIGVYRDLAMPDFSATLLALMGISGAGYVGFKYPEKNN
jgi:hypothetical protein